MIKLDSAPVLDLTYFALELIKDASGIGNYVVVHVFDLVGCLRFHSLIQLLQLFVEFIETLSHGIIDGDLNLSVHLGHELSSKTLQLLIDVTILRPLTLLKFLQGISLDFLLQIIVGVVESFLEVACQVLCLEFDLGGYHLLSLGDRS